MGQFLHMKSPITPTCGGLLFSWSPPVFDLKWVLGQHSVLNDWFPVRSYALLKIRNSNFYIIPYLHVFSCNKCICVLTCFPPKCACVFMCVSHILSLQQSSFKPLQVLRSVSLGISYSPQQHTRAQWLMDRWLAGWDEGRRGGTKGWATSWEESHVHTLMMSSRPPCR